jgi:predicted AAA+ superfamily ATPase
MKERQVYMKALAALEDFPALLLLGPRQIGKSTFAKQLVQQGYFSHYVTLDDLTTWEAAATDPHAFLSRYTAPVVIDEIQRAPELLIAIKKSIDENREPGRYLLTGSANILQSSAVKESLSGRVAILYLDGLSVRETCDILTKNPLLDLLTTPTDETTLTDALQELSVLSDFTEHFNELIFYGQYPEVMLKQKQSFTLQWYESYQKTYVERDIQLIQSPIDIIAYNRLLRLVAARTANLINFNDLASDMQMDKRTLQRYLDLMQLTFQINMLPPWFHNVGKRFVKSPKLFFNDTGFACYLLGLTYPDALESSSYIGALIETWCHIQLQRLIHLNYGVELYFYRSYTQSEVDFVLSRGEHLIGIEVKATTQVTAKDFSGLRDLMQVSKHLHFIGLVLYRGHEVICFGKNLYAVPMGVLY